jgi:hypothetical protein
MPSAGSAQLHAFFGLGFASCWAICVADIATKALWPKAARPGAVLVVCPYGAAQSKPHQRLCIGAVANSFAPQAERFDLRFMTSP